jgi:putative addiction module component (TIGR02574 family)
MSVEQIEASIRALPPAERAQFVEWFDDHRSELVADDVSEAQKAELLRRRREYDEHPERFVRMDKKSLGQMFNRVRKNVAARLSSAR